MEDYNNTADDCIIGAAESVEFFKSNHRVVIVQRRLTHYRVLFYELLRQKLALQNIQLDLLVGSANIAEQSKQDGGFISWAKIVPTYYFWNDKLCLQFYKGYLSNADLVVIVQENGLLNNLLLLFPLRSFKLAFWGHGANLQSKNPNGIKERFKKWTTKKVDWWFAYSQLSYELIKKESFNPNHITILNNAIDTQQLQLQAKSVTALDTQVIRDSLGFGAGKVGVFIGSFYSDKRLDFLFSSAKLIRQSLPDFNLLLIGNGPEHNKVQDFCATHPWAVWVGSKVDKEKATYLSLAQLILNPGLVGLNILDSFSCGIPLLTTNCGIHSPEISYLQNGSNGVITEDNITIYSLKAIELLQNTEELENLRLGCHNSATIYTIENMVKNFADGVVKCLANDLS